MIPSFASVIVSNSMIWPKAVQIEYKSEPAVTENRNTPNIAPVPSVCRSFVYNDGVVALFQEFALLPVTNDPLGLLVRQ
jgi:hypothetical protein